MEVLEHGYRFFTLHNEDGNVAHIDAHWERFQTQAPILPRQPFGLDFYGKGSSIELLFTTLPRRAAPERMAGMLRSRTRTPLPAVAPSVSLISNSIFISRTSPEPPPPAPPDTLARVNPVFDSPFDIDFLDGWGLDPLPFPPVDQPPGGGGGGGGGLFHSAVRVELFLFGSDRPLETWDLPEGIFSRFRSVKWQPQGFPNPDHPVRKTTWFRVVVTPQSFDPVEIYVGANTRIADVPIRTTPLGVRLTNHLFRVGLEALAPFAVADGSRVHAGISDELTRLVGADPVYVEKDLGPVRATGKLRTLKITSVSGAHLHEHALAKYRERAAKFPGPGTANQKAAVFFKGRLARLAEVQNDFVCIRIDAGFSKAAVSIWGFELAKLNGELGEMFLAFDHRMNRLRCFCFFDVNLSAVVSIARDIVDLFADVPDSVNEAIEQIVESQQTHLLKYLPRVPGARGGPQQRGVRHQVPPRRVADPQFRRSPDPEAGPAHASAVRARRPRGCNRPGTGVVRRGARRHDHHASRGGPGTRSPRTGARRAGASGARTSDLRDVGNVIGFDCRVASRRAAGRLPHTRRTTEPARSPPVDRGRDDGKPLVQTTCWAISCTFVRIPRSRTTARRSA